MFNGLAVSSVHSEAPNGRPSSQRAAHRHQLGFALRDTPWCASVGATLGPPSSHSENELSREEKPSRKKNCHQLSSFVRPHSGISAPASESIGRIGPIGLIGLIVYALCGTGAVAGATGCTTPELRTRDFSLPGGAHRSPDE